MKYLRMIWRVARRLVWETAMDNTTGLAAQMAYVLLFALAPGTLFLWHLLGLFGTDPTKLHRMYVLLRSFMPPDPKVQDILDSAIASVVVTGTSGLLANAGILLGIYFGTVFIATVSRALSHMHGVQEDRHWWSKYIISFFMLFWFGIVIVFSFNAVVFGERLAGILRRAEAVPDKMVNATRGESPDGAGGGSDFKMAAITPARLTSANAFRPDAIS